MNYSKHLQDYERDLNQIRYSKETIKNYVSQIKLFLNYFKDKDSLKLISADDIKNYLQTKKNTP